MLAAGPRDARPAKWVFRPSRGSISSCALVRRVEPPFQPPNPYLTLLVAWTFSPQVFPGETMRELCDRVLIDPFDKGIPEVTWANTCIPLWEHVDQLAVTKPWQLNLKQGNDVLTMTVPRGVDVRETPAESSRSSARSAPHLEKVSGETAEVDIRSANCEAAPSNAAAGDDIFSIRETSRGELANDIEGAGVAPAELDAAAPGARVRRDRSKPVRLINTEEGPQLARKTRKPRDETSVDRTAQDAAQDVAPRCSGAPEDLEPGMRGRVALSEVYKRAERKVAISEDGEDATADVHPSSGAVGVSSAPGANASAGARGDSTTDDELTESAAVGLLAVASGNTTVRKRRKVAPRTTIPDELVAAAAHMPRATKAASRRTNDTIVKAAERARNALAAGKPMSQLAGWPGMNLQQAQWMDPAMLAAFRAGQQLGATGQGMYGLSPFTRAATPGQMVPGAGPLQQMPQPRLVQSPSVADIVAKYYKHKAPDGMLKDPLQSFRNQTSGDAGASPTGYNAGSHADNGALLQWRDNLARLGLAGQHHPGQGAFVVDPNDSRFQPPQSRDILKATYEKNQSELMRLSSTMEQLRRVVTSITVEVPADMRMVILSRAQRLLTGICESAPHLSAMEKSSLSEAVVEVQLWLQAQLKERLDEAMMHARSSQSAARKPSGPGASMEKGKMPNVTTPNPVAALESAAADLQAATMQASRAAREMRALATGAGPSSMPAVAPEATGSGANANTVGDTARVHERDKNSVPPVNIDARAGVKVSPESDAVVTETGSDAVTGGMDVED